MTNRRSDYLALLGLTEWVRRDQAGREEPVLADAVAPAPALEPGPASAPTVVDPPEAPAALPLVDVAARPAEVAPGPAGVCHAPAPRDWEALAAQVAACTACPLHETRTQTVFGVGQRQADLMLVGEGPGEQEDLRGEPFVGAAGQLLDQMLAAIGQSRASTVYIANVVKCRPPGNRKPHAAEAAACRDYLEAQIELVRPRLIVALGQVAAAGLLGEDAPVGRMRQGSHVHPASQTPVIVTYHPAYYLRQPLEKRKGWEDLKRIRALLNSPR